MAVIPNQLSLEAKLDGVENISVIVPWGGVIKFDTPVSYVVGQLAEKLLQHVKFNFLDPLTRALISKNMFLVQFRQTTDGEQVVLYSEKGDETLEREPLKKIESTRAQNVIHATIVPGIKFTPFGEGRTGSSSQRLIHRPTLADFQQFNVMLSDWFRGMAVDCQGIRYRQQIREEVVKEIYFEKGFMLPKTAAEWVLSLYPNSGLEINLIEGLSFRKILGVVINEASAETDVDVVGFEQVFEKTLGVVNEFINITRLLSDNRNKVSPGGQEVIDRLTAELKSEAARFQTQTLQAAENNQLNSGFADGWIKALDLLKLKIESNLLPLTKGYTRPGKKEQERRRAIAECLDRIHVSIVKSNWKKIIEGSSNEDKEFLIQEYKSVYGPLLIQPDFSKLRYTDPDDSLVLLKHRSDFYIDQSTVWVLLEVVRQTATGKFARVGYAVLKKGLDIAIGTLKFLWKYKLRIFGVAAISFVLGFGIPAIFSGGSAVGAAGLSGNITATEVLTGISNITSTATAAAGTASASWSLTSIGSSIVSSVFSSQILTNVGIYTGLLLGQGVVFAIIDKIPPGWVRNIANGAAVFGFTLAFWHFTKSSNVSFGAGLQWVKDLLCNPYVRHQIFWITRLLSDRIGFRTIAQRAGFTTFLDIASYIVQEIGCSTAIGEFFGLGQEQSLLDSLLDRVRGLNKEVESVAGVLKAPGADVAIKNATETLEATFNQTQQVLEDVQKSVANVTGSMPNEALNQFGSAANTTVENLTSLAKELQVTVREPASRDVLLRIKSIETQAGLAYQNLTASAQETFKPLENIASLDVSNQNLTVYQNTTRYYNLTLDQCLIGESYAQTSSGGSIPGSSFSLKSPVQPPIPAPVEQPPIAPEPAEVVSPEVVSSKEPSSSNAGMYASAGGVFSLGAMGVKYGPWAIRVLRMFALRFRPINQNNGLFQGENDGDLRVEASEDFDFGGLGGSHGLDIMESESEAFDIFVSKLRSLVTADEAPLVSQSNNPMTFEGRRKKSDIPEKRQVKFRRVKEYPYSVEDEESTEMQISTEPGLEEEEESPEDTLNKIYRTLPYLEHAARGEVVDNKRYFVFFSSLVPSLYPERRVQILHEDAGIGYTDVLLKDWVTLSIPDVDFVRSRDPARELDLNMKQEGQWTLIYSYSENRIYAATLGDARIKTFSYQAQEISIRLSLAESLIIVIPENDVVLIDESVHDLDQFRALYGIPPLVKPTARQQEEELRITEMILADELPEQEARTLNLKLASSRAMLTTMRMSALMAAASIEHELIK